MPIRTLSITSKPGDVGFVDDVNAAFSEIAKAAKNILRVEMRLVQFTGTRTFSHSLGVTPIFVWGMEADGVSSSLECSEAEKKTWDARTVRFTLNGAQHYVWIFANR